MTNNHSYRNHDEGKPDPCARPGQPSREHVLRKFSEVGWHIKGSFTYVPPEGIGMGYTVEYQALIDPWSPTREMQLVNYKISLPNDLGSELLRPVREMAKELIYKAMDEAESTG